jgi:hypothetical protein
MREMGALFDATVPNVFLHCQQIDQLKRVLKNGFFGKYWAEMVQCGFAVQQHIW